MKADYFEVKIDDAEKKYHKEGGIHHPGPPCWFLSLHIYVRKKWIVWMRVMDIREWAYKRRALKFETVVFHVEILKKCSVQERFTALKQSHPLNSDRVTAQKKLSFFVF